MLKAGIVGLPNVGKSTLFNALTSSYQAESANYPFCTIEPNSGIVKVHDPRLLVLQELVKTPTIIPAVFEFVDIAGLVRGASRGEGLGNQFLAHIREVHAVVHVVRCFENADIVHVDGSVDPIRDLETIQIELCLADADSLTRRLERLRKSFKQGDKKVGAELAVFEKILPIVESGGVVELATYPDEEQQILRKSQLLSAKPVIYAANVNEDELADPSANPHLQRLREQAAREKREVVVISAQIEAELSQLSAEEKQEYLDSLGVKSSGVQELINAAFRALGMVTYFTAGVQEARAWPFTRGMTAPQCAGIIHSDFEKGFIRAEVISYDEYVACGGEKGAKDKGVMRLEGRDYLMKDGDVVHFRFNV